MDFLSEGLRTVDLRFNPGDRSTSLLTLEARADFLRSVLDDIV